VARGTARAARVDPLSELADLARAYDEENE